MVDLSSLRGPTPEQALRAYHFHRDRQLPLYNDQLDERPDHRPKDTTRLIEGDLIPVADRPCQQLAKRCSDLHDQFLASATVDNNNHGPGDNSVNNNGTDNNGADNNETNTHGGVMGNNGGADNSGTNNNKAGDSKEPQPSPTTAHNNTNNAPKQTLHIPLQDYLEFTTLYHTLTNPPAATTGINMNQTPTPQHHQDLPTLHAHLRQTTHRLLHQETLLTQRETALAQREAAAALLYDEALLTKQLTDLWQHGFEQGRQQGQGQSSQSQSAAGGLQQHAPANNMNTAVLEGILTRVREIQSKAGCPPGVVGVELEGLEKEVEGFVRGAWGKQARGGGSVGGGAKKEGQQPQQARPSGGGRQAGVAGVGGAEDLGMAVEGSHGRPVVDKGKGRMAVAARGQDGDVGMMGGLVVAPKGRRSMAAPSTLVRVNRIGAGLTAAAEGQGQDDVDMEDWLNMDEMAEGDVGGA